MGLKSAPLLCVLLLVALKGVCYDVHVHAPTHTHAHTHTHTHARTHARTQSHKRWMLARMLR